MIKIEYAIKDEHRMSTKCEMRGTREELAEELGNFLEDLHERDPKLVVMAIDTFLDLIGFDLKEGSEDDD